MLGHGKGVPPRDRICTKWVSDGQISRSLRCFILRRRRLAEEAEILRDYGLE